MDKTNETLPVGRDLWPWFLRRVAADYEQGLATPEWEIPSVISRCLRTLAEKIDEERGACISTS